MEIIYRYQLIVRTNLKGNSPFGMIEGKTSEAIFTYFQTTAYGY